MALNNAVWLPSWSRTSAANARKAATRTLTAFTAESPNAARTRISTVPCLANSLWFARQPCKRCCFIIASSSSSLFKCLRFPLSSSGLTSRCTVSSAHNVFAAFCAEIPCMPALPISRSTAAMPGTLRTNPLSRNKVWLLGLSLSKLLHNSKQSCTTTPPSTPPSSRITANARSNAPSNATIFCNSSFPLVSDTRSNSISLRITSFSFIASISVGTAVGSANIPARIASPRVSLASLSVCAACSFE